MTQMVWILIILKFTGPTSVDEIKYGGTFPTKELCDVSARNDQARSYVCVPIEEIK